MAASWEDPLPWGPAEHRCTGGTYGQSWGLQRPGGWTHPGGGSPNPSVLPQGAVPSHPVTPANLARWSPGQHPQLRPEAYPQCRGPSARTLVSGAGRPPGCCLGLPPGRALTKPVSASRGCAMRSLCDLGEGRGSCPGEIPGPAANTLTDAAAPVAPGGPSAQSINSPATESVNRSGKGPSPSGANVGRNDVRGRRPRAGGRQGVGGRLYKEASGECVIHSRVNLPGRDTGSAPPRGSWGPFNVHLGVGGRSICRCPPCHRSHLADLRLLT